MSRKRLMWLGCGVMVLVGGYLLWAKGYRNIGSYGMLLLCPLMHLFMLGSHGHSSHSHSAPTCCSEGTTQEEKSGEHKPACH